MRILSLDASLRSTGYIISNDAEIVKIGTIRTDKNDCLGKNLFFVFCNLLFYIKKYKIEIVAAESQYIGGSVQCAYVLGILNLIAYILKIPIYSFSPKTIKKLCTGNGNANKKIMKEYIIQLFDISDIKTNEHERDALGVLFTYLNKDKIEIKEKKIKKRIKK